MGLLRKTTGMLRLEPGSDAWLKQGAFVRADEGISPEELRPLLKTLLSEASLVSPEARDMLGRLRELSTKAGPFLTASEIQRALRKYKFVDDDGHPLCTARAYELASKLHWEHVHRQIDAIEAHSKPMGPTVFATFLEEMVECLLRGDEPRKAAEIPVVMADELLARLLEPSPHTLEYMVLAERSIGTSLDCCRGWIAEEAERAAARANEIQSEGEPTISAERAPDVPGIDLELVEYLKELDGAFRALSLELHELMFPIDTCTFVARGDEALRPEQMRAYLELLAGIAKKADYAPLGAMALEALSESFRGEDAGRAREIAARAAALYGAETEKDARLNLTILAHKRLHAAERLRDLKDAI